MKHSLELSVYKGDLPVIEAPKIFDVLRPERVAQNFTTLRLAISLLQPSPVACNVRNRTPVESLKLLWWKIRVVRIKEVQPQKKAPRPAVR
jgi:hypothetical protein